MALAVPALEEEAHRAAAPALAELPGAVAHLPFLAVALGRRREHEGVVRRGFGEPPALRAECHFPASPAINGDLARLHREVPDARRVRIGIHDQLDWQRVSIHLRHDVQGPRQQGFRLHQPPQLDDHRLLRVRREDRKRVAGVDVLVVELVPRRSLQQRRQRVAFLDDVLDAQREAFRPLQMEQTGRIAHRLHAGGRAPPALGVRDHPHRRRAGHDPDPLDRLAVLVDHLAPEADRPVPPRRQPVVPGGQDLVREGWFGHRRPRYGQQAAGQGKCGEAVGRGHAVSTGSRLPFGITGEDTTDTCTAEACVRRAPGCGCPRRCAAQGRLAPPRAPRPAANCRSRSARGAHRVQETNHSGKR